MSRLRWRHLAHLTAAVFVAWCFVAVVLAGDAETIRLTNVGQP